MNKVWLIGRLVNDAIMSENTSVARASFTVAVDDKRMANTEPKTNFINCTAWGPTANYIHNYVHKGYLVSIEGRIEVRKYTVKETNENRSYTNVIVESIQSLTSTRTNLKTKPLEEFNTQKSNVEDLFPETGVTTNFEKVEQKIEPLKPEAEVNNTTEQTDNDSLDWYLSNETTK